MKPDTAPLNLPPIYRPPKKTIAIRKVAIDLATFASLLLGIILFYSVGQPFRRGFNCDDDSIRYPFRNNTISGSSNYLYSTLIPAATFAVNEFFLVRSHFSGHQADLIVSPLFWQYYGWQVYLQLVPLGFAATTSQFLTDIAKYSIGRLRPHFIDLCRPQLPNGLVMDRFSNCQNPHTYVTTYSCTNYHLSERRIKDGHLSFMSGHSSFAAVCLIYLIIYIQLRLQNHTIGILKNFYQACLLFLIFYTGMSRVSDYKHHWSDVLAGLAQGSSVAILVAVFVSDLFKPRSYENMQRVTINQNGINGNGNGNGNGDFKDLQESGV